MKILIYDIETLLEEFSISIYFPETNEWRDFAINRWQSDLYGFLKFIEDHKDYYWVGYNNVNFDWQIIEMIHGDHEKWLDLTNLQECRIIWQFGQDVISDGNYGKRLPYWEGNFYCKQIDLFRIHHFDNKNKRVSLKWLEFMMDMDNIEDMPIHHAQKDLTKEDLLEIKKYRRNDVESTYKFYRYTIGEIGGEEYLNKNMIQDRVDLIAEGLLPELAMNYANSKIGDELNKITYSQLAGISTKQLYFLKKERKPTRKFKYSDAIPEYITFETPELKRFVIEVGKELVSLKEKDEQFFPLTFRGTNYKIARGGLHSNEKNRIIEPLSNELLRDADVGAQYPWAIFKRKLFPKHLGPLWTQVCEINLKKKDEAKQKGKKATDPREIAKWKGIENMWKYALNGGLFGKTLERTNWQYGPEVGYYCTIGNQFEILKLIEMLELRGIHCVSANTDGIVCLFDKSLEERYNTICKEWEVLVGNTEGGKLEFTDFKLLAQESINHYVAVKTDGKLKIKGRIAYDGVLSKNNTAQIGRIERKAIIDHFAKNIPIEKTIRECTEIQWFVRGRKNNKDYHYELINPITGEGKKLKKVIRYYITKDEDKGRLVKIKNPDSEASGPSTSEAEAPDKILQRVWYCKVENNFDKTKTIEDYHIDYDFYIEKAKKVIQPMERKVTKRGHVYNPNQQSLF